MVCACQRVGLCTRRPKDSLGKTHTTSPLMSVVRKNFKNLKRQHSTHSRARALLLCGGYGQPGSGLRNVGEANLSNTHVKLINLTLHFKKDNANRK